MSDHVLSDLQECFADHTRAVYCLSTVIPAFVNHYAFDALLPAVEMYQAFIDDSNDEFELWKQRWHAAAEPPKTALDVCTTHLHQHNASLYPNLCISCCRCSSLNRHHCHGRAFLFHSQTAKDIQGGPEKVSHKVLSICLPNIDRFSKFFHYCIL